MQIGSTSKHVADAPCKRWTPCTAFQAFGADIITDFASSPVVGQDLIDISGLGITAATFASLSRSVGESTHRSLLMEARSS